MLEHTIYAVFDHNRNYLYNESNNYQYDNDTPIKEIPLPSYIPPLSIKSITSGNDFLLLLTVDGLVYVYGSNEEGRIGLGVSVTNVDKFTKIENLNKIIKIANSSECSILLSEKNELFVTGLNNGNRFGFEDDSDNIYCFIKIDSLYNNELNNLQNEIIKLIRVSYDFIYLVTEKNVIYGCGLNDGGQLGLGHTNRLNKFTKNETLQNINIKDLQCGDCHCLILDFNGNVYCCGLNNLSQLTYEYISSIIYFTKYYENIKSIHCNANDSILLTLQNEIYFIGKDSNNKSNFTKYTMTDTFINSIKTDNLGDASILSNNSKEMFCNYKDLFKNYIYDDKTEKDITILVEAIDHKYKKINVPNCFDKYLNYFIIGISDSNIFILLSDYQFTDEDNNERQIKNLKLFFNNLLQQCLLTHKNNFCDVIIKYF